MQSVCPYVDVFSYAKEAIVHAPGHSNGCLLAASLPSNVMMFPYVLDMISMIRRGPICVIAKHLEEMRVRNLRRLNIFFKAICGIRCFV